MSRILQRFCIALVFILGINLGVPGLNPGPAWADHGGPHTSDVNHKGWEYTFDNKWLKVRLKLAAWKLLRTCLDISVSWLSILNSAMSGGSLALERSAPAKLIGLQAFDVGEHGITQI